MHITEIKLYHFRNYERQVISGFSEGVNVFYGKNAQGKTNLLEAVSMCSVGRSFRVPVDSRVIKFGADSAYASVAFVKKGVRQTVELLIEKNRKKAVKLNGVPLKSVRELLGNLQTVVFSPEDIKMAREAPGLRRAFLDGEISKIRPPYIDAIKKYTRIVAQKSAALKRNTADTKRVIEAYNGQLADYAAIILKNRNAYIARLNAHVSDVHRAIAGGGEKIEIRYRPTFPGEDAGEALARLLPREMEERAVFAGPHRDDMDILIDGRDIRYYASQGQVRTLILAVKIACLRILEEYSGSRPILLLDDVYSELDAARRQNLQKALCGLQVFITTAEREKPRPDADEAHFKVCRGVVDKT